MGGDAVDPNFGNAGSAGGVGEPLNGGTGGSGPFSTGLDGGGGGGWYGGGGGGGGGSGVTAGAGGGGGSSFISLVNAAEVGLDDFANPRVEITPVTVTSTRVTCTTPVPAGSPARCTASVPNQTTGFPVATGTVTWSVTSGSGTFNRQSCALNDSGRCSVAFRPELGAPMTLTIRAEYGGDTNHLASSGTRDIQVNVP